jgi:hypothetical protein
MRSARGSQIDTLVNLSERQKPLHFEKRFQKWLSQSHLTIAGIRYRWYLVHYVELNTFTGHC